MATFQGKSPKNTYKSILSVDSTAGVDSTLRTVQTGDGVATPLKVSTTAVSVAGPMAVTGASTLSGGTTITGGASINGVTMPTDGATAGKVLTVGSDGVSTSWATPAPQVSVAGTTGQMQYNNAGALAGTSKITTDGAKLTFTDTAAHLVGASDGYVRVTSPNTALTAIQMVPPAGGTISYVASSNRPTGFINANSAVIGSNDAAGAYIEFARYGSATSKNLNFISNDNTTYTNVARLTPAGNFVLSTSSAATVSTVTASAEYLTSAIRDQNAPTRNLIANFNTGAAAYATFQAANPGASGYFGMTGSGFATNPNEAFINTDGTSTGFVVNTLSGRRLAFDNNGNIVIGSAALATTATNGFLYLNASAGAPTGTPATTYAGRVPVTIDSTNKALYMYAGGAWSAVTGGSGGTATTPGGTSGQIQYNNAGVFGGSIISQGTNTITVGSLANGGVASPTKITMDQSYANTVTPSNQQLKLSLGNFGSTQGYGFGLSNDAGLWAHAGDTTAATTGYFAFAVAGSEKLRVTALGNLVMGAGAVDSATAPISIVRTQNGITRFNMQNASTAAAGQCDAGFLGSGSNGAFFGLQTSGAVSDATVTSTTLTTNDAYAFSQSSTHRMSVFTNSTRRLTVTASGNVVIGVGALATTATDGYFFISTSAGAPTAAPTAITGRAPIHIDSTNNIFYYYNSGWKAVGGVQTGTQNTFTKAQVVAPATLTDAATITLDASTSNNFKIVLAGNRTLANPTNLVDGQIVNIRISQDATGGRSLVFGTVFKFPGGVLPSLSTGPNAVDLISGYYDATLGALLCSINKDFR